MDQAGGSGNFDQQGRGRNSPEGKMGREQSGFSVDGDYVHPVHGDSNQGAGESEARSDSRDSRELEYYTIVVGVPPPSDPNWQKIAVEMTLNSSLLVPTKRERECLRMAIRNVHGQGAAMSRETTKGYRVWRVR